MICPHCNTGVNLQFQRQFLTSFTQEEAWATDTARCPECRKVVIFLFWGRPVLHPTDRPIKFDAVHGQTRAWPVGTAPYCPLEVPEDISKDFIEACNVLPISAQASAALSRRCLQRLLVSYSQADGDNLQQQIESFITQSNPPSYIADQLRTVRNLGNFAAHPQKDHSTGEILPVEPEEAEWNIEVLKSMFDFQFVKPAQQKKRTAEFNQKLQAAGKPTI